MLIAGVVDRSPAQEAGLRRGDVILQMDGQPIDDPDGFGYRLATRQLNSTSSLSVMRGRNRLVVPVRMVVAPETRPRDPVRITGRGPLAGATVVNLSPAVAEELGLEASAEGAAVLDVEADSPAASSASRRATSSSP